MLGVELIRYRADQDRDRSDRNVNAEREREAELLVMGDDRTPEFGVARPVSFAGQQSQADVAEFIEGAFCGGGNDQHQYKDAGQSYFGFHGYLLFVTGRSSFVTRSEEHTSELQSLRHLVCRLLLEK